MVMVDVSADALLLKAMELAQINGSDVRGRETSIETLMREFHITAHRALFWWTRAVRKLQRHKQRSA